MRLDERGLMGEEKIERGLKKRTQYRVRLGDIERNQTLLKSNFCKHLYRYTKIIET
jgi:hypothetical protein